MRLTVDSKSTLPAGRSALAVLATIAAAAAIATTASATPLRSSARPCGFVAQAAPWSFKGQKGTAYTVVVEGGANCSTARTWVPRFTREHAAFDLTPVPAGWHCSTLGGLTTGLTMSGQCTTLTGGIVEWLPKLKQ